MQPKICAACGAEYVPVAWNQKYCSSACASERKARNDRDRLIRERRIERERRVAAYAAMQERFRRRDEEYEAWTRPPTVETRKDGKIVVLHFGQRCCGYAGPAILRSY